MNDKDIKKISFAIGIFLIVLFNIIGVSAEIQTLKPVEVNKCMNLVQLYANSSFNNVTVVESPNKTLYLINKQMTNLGGGYFNYTFCNTSEIGDYIVNGIGDQDGVITTWNYDFSVTSTGAKVSLSNVILIIAFLVVSVIIFVIGNNIDKEKFIIKSAFYLFSLLLGLLAIYSAGVIASESVVLTRMSLMGLILMLAVISFMFLYVFIVWSVNTFKSMRSKEEARWEV